jgi:hypothetical protein
MSDAERPRRWRAGSSLRCVTWWRLSVTGACYLWLSRPGFHNAANVGGGLSASRLHKLRLCSSNQADHRVMTDVAAGDGSIAKYAGAGWKSIRTHNRISVMYSQTVQV